MEEEILKSLLMRDGMDGKERLLKDMISDSVVDIKNFLNCETEDALPDGCVTAVKELTLIRFNQDGIEGIQSETQSAGGSTTYLHDLPDKIKRTVRKYRRLPRCLHVNKSEHEKL